jgi:hypothetical protein
MEGVPAADDGNIRILLGVIESGALLVVEHIDCAHGCFLADALVRVVLDAVMRQELDGVECLIGVIWQENRKKGTSAGFGA